MPDGRADAGGNLIRLHPDDMDYIANRMMEAARQEATGTLAVRLRSDAGKRQTRGRMR